MLIHDVPKINHDYNMLKIDEYNFIKVSMLLLSITTLNTVFW